MKGTIVKGLFKEVYGKYEGTFQEDGQHIYITTDRYFEKHVLLTDDGVYEIWAGGFRKKDDIDLAGFEPEKRFPGMTGSTIVGVMEEPERSLTLILDNDSFFEIGLCSGYNRYNHPERYMKFIKAPDNLV